jgi:hypothetical protein
MMRVLVSMETLLPEDGTWVCSQMDRAISLRFAASRRSHHEREALETLNWDDGVVSQNPARPIADAGTSAVK